MSFRKPFEAVPIKLGEQHRERTEARQAESDSAKKRAVLRMALLGLLAGAGIGTAAISLRDSDFSWSQDIAPISAGPAQSDARPQPLFGPQLRTRPPQAGDHWPGCNAARAAGTAPIYFGEPGYRSGMDGDGDGIACEPLPPS